MKKVKQFLHTVSLLFSGAIASDLWLMDGDNWKLYLPMCLMCITLGQGIKGE